MICISQARIKRIMQKDEEVGKVAQATPVVICCVVPAGIIQLALSHWNFDSQSVGDVPRDVGGGIKQGHCCERVQEGGGVSSVSLFSALRFLARFDAIWGLATRKHAVETVEMLDFLKEIVEPVPDPSAGGTINLEAEDNNGGGEAKKRRAPKGKKSTVGDEEEGGAPAPKRRRRKKKEEEAEDVAMGGTGGGDEDEE